MPGKHELGLEAEDRAAEYLIGLGYTLLTRRYRVRGGEIDLIALHGETLVFVEVKVRETAGFTPEEAVGVAKVASMVRTAQEFQNRMNDHREVRFDLIAIDREGLRHYTDCYGTEIL